ncbi:MAG: hypothetical protein EXS31_10630 [Pedosphaera sp.]|nr:hypothetical protein [Pedosphaera sp.]
MTTVFHARYSACVTLKTLVSSTSLVFLFAAGCATTSSDSPSKGVSIRDTGKKLIIQIAGQPFSEYHYKDVPRPFLYPISGPGAAPMTRNWPMADAANEEQDHPHHRSLWFTHGDVNGQDFWSEAPTAGKVVHQNFVKVRSGADVGTVTERNNWVARDGTVTCSDVRTMRIFARPGNERVLDLDVTLHAGKSDVVLGDTKEGTMAIRLNEAMRLKGKIGTGHIVNSEGVRDGDTWGKRAKWCDYHGLVNGKTVGVAIFDHPSNPRHPTWWHVRDYGLFAANPFGLHDFEKKPVGAGNLTIPAGKSLTFRYRFYLHEGNEQQARVEERYRNYASGKL